jgi:hypothetical protein
MTIEAHIQEGIEKIEGKLRLFPERVILFDEYRFPQIEITNFFSEGENNGVAKTKLTIEKGPALYEKRFMNPDQTIDETKTEIFKNLDEYWKSGTKNMLQDPRLGLSEKAYMLLQLQENMEKLYSDEHPAETQEVVDITQGLIKKLIDESNETKEKIRFQIGTERVKTNIPQIKQSNVLNVINFFKNIFFNQETYTAIQEHEKQGLFDKNVPCEVDLVAEVEYR